jgi:signal transduction histidine kinase
MAVALRHGTPFRNAEIAMVRPDGREVHVAVNIDVTRDAAGRITGAISVFTDITERKRAEEQMRQAAEDARAANRLKDQFLATVSHELRTPLAATLIWAQLLKGGTLDEGRRAVAIDTIIQSAKDQSQLVADLLDSAGILHGKLRADMRPLDLAAVVAAAVDPMRPQARDKGIEIDLVCADARVLGDASRIKQVAVNLLSNAIKFTPGPGRVEVQISRHESVAQLRFTDTGVGIAPEFLPGLFERFRQADGSTTRQHGGLGLGLYIVKSLVDLHGGSIRGHSEGAGRGATFTVTLPLLGADVDANEEAARISVA